MKFSKRLVDFTEPRIMGILNITPDSFSDGGELFTKGQVHLDRVLRRAKTMVADGADFIDVGGESTRPGAKPVPLQQELDRVLPVVELLDRELDVVISVDTSTAEVMREAVQLGAGLINDVRALTRSDALSTVAKASKHFDLAVCLMHMQGTPETMQHAPSYKNPVTEVYDYLFTRRQDCIDAGIPSGQIIVDPGIGFGKTDAHNLALIAQFAQFQSLGATLLGVSRKSLFERLLGRPLDRRLAGGLACAARALQQGVSILRVHDVAETSDLVKMWLMTATQVD